MALGLPSNYIRAGLMKAAEAPKTMKAPKGRAVILAGSCSQATRGQVATAKKAGVATYKLEPLALATHEVRASDVLAWTLTQPADKPVMIYSSAEPSEVAKVQDVLGRDAAGHLVESTLAAIAIGLAANGFTRFLVAGGETSGAVVNELGVTALEIGPEIDPGVPWTRAIDAKGGGKGIVLALKSGNFGATDFFLKAWSKLS